MKILNKFILSNIIVRKEELQSLEERLAALDAKFNFQ